MKKKLKPLFILILMFLTITIGCPTVAYAIAEVEEIEIEAIETDPSGVKGVKELEEVVTIMERLPDVLENNPYYESIYRVNYEGIMRENTQGLFDPYKPVTRVELAVILTRLLSLEESDNQIIFIKDLSPEYWGYSAITKVVNKGLMLVDQEGNFNPTAEASRKDFEALGYVGGEEEITRGLLAEIIERQYCKEKNLTFEVVTNEAQGSKYATINYLSTLRGEYSSSTEILRTKGLVTYLLEQHGQITYNNYEFYRSTVDDTTRVDMLKAYSEGLIPVEENKLYPDKPLTREEVVGLLEGVKDPNPPTRPIYEKRANIPILMYHEINTLPSNGSEGLYVSENNFIAQLDALKKEGYHTVTMEQVYQHWADKEPLPKKPIVLTFDDGYKSHRKFVTEELTKRGMTGTFYVMLGQNFINNSWHVTEEEIKEMDKLGMEIGSHTLNHIDARNNSNVTILKEYGDSKVKLEELLDKEVKHFCYPYGGTTKYAMQALQDLGYKTAVITTHGKANEKQGLLELRRIRIDYYDSLIGYLNKIS